MDMVSRTPAAVEISGQRVDMACERVDTLAQVISAYLFGREDILLVEEEDDDDGE